MYPRLYFTKFFIISFALHALVIVAALFLIKPTTQEIPLVTPVRIVNLPQRQIKQLPLARQPAPQRIVPERPLPPGAVPMPRKFGESDEIRLPKTLPRTGRPKGAEQGKETGKTSSRPHKETGPLPFLSQNDIEELARKGMPKKKPGDDSVTLDTDEFKFISYNRWLKIKIESVGHYPELAAVSGYQGVVYLRFDIMKDGSLGTLETLKSSGYKILDDEALRAIRSSAPFQPLPEDWKMERYTLRGAVIFHINGFYIR